MTMLRFVPLIAAMISSPVAAEPLSRDAAYEAIEGAHRTRDAALAAAQYAPGAVLTLRYPDGREQRLKGRAAIAGSFASLFGQVPRDEPLDLDFRVVHRAGRSESGYYRLRIGAASVHYGRFEVTRDPNGRFLTDISSIATEADFLGQSPPT